MPEVNNIKGKRFGNLIVLSQVRKRSKDRHVVWLCLCDCGKKKKIQGNSLRAGLTRGCGCNLSTVTRARNFRHGYSVRGRVAPEYRAYTSAKDRCRKSAKPHERYFDRGIRFKFSSFSQFIEELGNRPSPQHSLDRKNNDGHYESGNVRWATASEQQKNKGNRYKEKIVILERRIKKLERLIRQYEPTYTGEPKA